MTLSSKRTSDERSPISSQFFTLLATYASLPPSWPTNIAARCGAFRPLWIIFFTSAANSFLICSATALPSIN